MHNDKNIIIGIDVGGSTTKIVGFEKTENGPRLIEPQIVRANDPVTSTYGAFGKFTAENNIELPDIEKIILTGVGSSYVTKPLYGLPCERAAEFDCISRGGILSLGSFRSDCCQHGHRHCDHSCG